MTVLLALPHQSSPPGLWVELFIRHSPLYPHHDKGTPQPSLLTCWAALALLLQPQTLPTPWAVPAPTAAGRFPLHALGPEPYFKMKRMSWSHHHNWHNSLPSALSPFSSAPYDLYLPFTHLTDLPFSLAIDLQEQASLSWALHPLAFWSLDLNDDKECKIFTQLMQCE